MFTWFKEESWGMMRTCFPDAKKIQKCPKNVLCKDCKYVQKNINESDDNFVSQPNNEHTFVSSFLQEGPIVNVEILNKG